MLNADEEVPNRISQQGRYLLQPDMWRTAMEDIVLEVKNVISLW